MQNFQILFDEAERPERAHPALARYGPLAFPASPPARPWVYANFVQSLDGIASFRGLHASGADISRSPEDRWLMDVLRAHADAVLLGINTLVEETALGRETGRETGRGPTYTIEAADCMELRRDLGKRKEVNIFVTGACALNLSDYAVFDGDRVESVVITTGQGVAKLRACATHPHVRAIVAGSGAFVDLALAMRLLKQELGLNHVLCEGGPTLYGHMMRAGVVDETFLTTSPLEIGLQVPPGQQPSALEAKKPPLLRPTIFGAPGFTFENAPQFRWLSSRRVGSHQFNRYRRSA